MLEAIDHVNIVVDDLDRMAEFYTALLQLKVTLRTTISGDWIDHTVGLTGVVADVIYLELSSGPRLELLRYRHPGGDRPVGLGAPNTPGLRHLAFRVHDIDALTGRLRRSGVEFFSLVQRVPSAQVTYANDLRKYLVYFRDPEGNLLEFCEYKRGE